jgi:superfamily II DNA/RNA helicase
MRRSCLAKRPISCGDRFLAVYGGGDGSGWDQEKAALSKGADIIVATPGRLISHLNQGYVKFNQIEVLVLDEADRMLDIGFYDDIMRIISHLPKKRQTLMFSATMPVKIRSMSKHIMKSPVEIALEMSKPAEGVIQAVYMLSDNKKLPLINSLIADNPEYHSILIFSSTKKKVSEIVRGLRSKNYLVEGISSDLEQKERELMLLRFRSRKTRVLVATDVLSRGIDIKDINLVINYDAPSDAEDYVHRVGRTARAETTGVAITLVNKLDLQKMQRIEKLIGYKVYTATLPDYIAAMEDKNSAPGHQHSSAKSEKRGFKRRYNNNKGKRQGPVDKQK